MRWRGQEALFFRQNFLFRPCHHHTGHHFDFFSADDTKLECGEMTEKVTKVIKSDKIGDERKLEEK